MNIILLGFMGAGKTSIGRKLALRLGYRFIDTDHHIEREQGKKIFQLFTKYGETHFRQLETDLLIKLIKARNTVISTGGGTLTTPENIEIIRKIGRSVNLKLGLKEIKIRLLRNMKNRPLLNTENPTETIEELFQVRHPLYEQADISIKLTSFKKGLIVSKIIRAL